MIDYGRAQAQRDMLRIWIGEDFGSRPRDDALASVEAALPRPATAGRMALAAWNGEGVEIGPLHAAIFGRAPTEDDEEPAALIYAASDGGNLSRYLTDDAAERVLSALGGLPIGAILAVRRLADEILVDAAASKIPPMGAGE